jgi:ABC-2 type transport system permease protein
LFYAGLIVDYLKTYMKTRLTYRADFALEVLTDLAYQFVSLAMIFVMFMHTEEIGGWSREEIVFIYGYFMIPYGIFQCFFNFYGFTERYIVKGEMDRVLTRPAYNLVQLSLENLDPSSLFGALTGAVIMGAAWSRLGLGFHVADVPALAVMVVGSVMIYAGIYVALTAVSFFTDAPTGILPLLYNIQNYGRYPANIYNAPVRILLTWVLPFAFVGFYPAGYFLDKEAMRGMALLTPAVGAVFFTMGVLVWNFGVRRYRGAGS